MLISIWYWTFQVQSKLASKSIELGVSERHFDITKDFVVLYLTLHPLDFYAVSIEIFSIFL
jgi:hypothetical protein